jgi:hypothetical protein
MSQFRSTGGLDDAIAADGDRGFFGVNQRLQLNQLEPGEVRESLNGRMEGFWRPRKSVVSVSPVLTTGGTPLNLPFHVLVVQKTITSVTRSGTTITVTANSHGFTNGDSVYISGVGYTTGSNPNGTFVIAGVATNTFQYTLAGADGAYTTTASTTAGNITQNFRAITAVSYTADVVTITVNGHGLAIGVAGNLTVSGITFTGTNNNGVKAVTAATVNTLTFPVTGVTAVALGATPRITQIDINDAAASEVLASCLFSDPNESNKEYIIVALETLAKKIDLSTTPYTATTIPYPVGATVGSNCDMLQCFDKVMIMRDGKQALEWYPNGRAILSASSNSTASPNTVVTMRVREHGLTAGSSVVIAGLTSGTPPNGTFTVATIVDQDSFTFVASGISTSTTFVTTAATMTDGFTLSPGGAYTQPQTFIVTGSDVTVSSGLATVTKATLGNNTIFAGDVIVIYEATIPEFTAIVGSQFQVVSATATTLTFYAPVGNITSGSSSQQLEFGGRFTEGGGFMHQPGAPWATYFQRRLFVPFYYSQSGIFSEPVYTSRKISDEIAVSDLLDTTTFDQIENQFRITGGTADYVVAMHGFYDDALVVLNRNSIHLVAQTQGSLSDTVVKELTGEVGCLARKTVVMQANNMLFLADEGVYGLTFLNDYNLRGTEEPLSKNIQPYIDRINKNLAGDSVAVYFNNRYYIAVPLDSVAGGNDARGNNAVLIYNFLNKGWESLDTYGDSRFLIKNFITASAGVRNNLYAVSSNGGLHQIDASDSSVDRLSVTNEDTDVVTPTINSYVTSRGYDFKTLERKRFTDAQVQMQNLTGETGEYDIAFATEDPDSGESIGTTTTFLGGQILSPSTAGEAETASIRCRLGGQRGYTGTITLTRTIGSPKIHSIQVAGSITNRQILSQK